MKNEDTILFTFLISVILIIGIFYLNSIGMIDFSSFLGNILPSTFRPEPKALSQYIGTLPLCCGYAWLATHPYSVSLSETAVIGDYKVITEKYSSGAFYDFLGCKKNSCNGNFLRIDDYECNVWGKVVQKTEVVCKGYPTVQCIDPNARSWDYFHAPSGKTVTCREYHGCPQEDITLSWTEMETCGGADLFIIKSGGGCYSEHKVYYKGNLIYETPMIANVLRKDFREGVEVLDISTSDLHIDFQKEALYFSSPYDWAGGHAPKGCSAVINEFYFRIPPNAFIFNIDIPDRQLVAGENVAATINITNNWMDTSGRLDLLVNIPYKVFGEQKQTSDTLKRFIDVKKGDNTFYFNLPTEQVTNMIYVTPTFYLLLKGTKFKGVNFYCFEQGNTKERDISSCEYLNLGTLSGDKFRLDVIPPIGYNESVIIELEEKIKQLELTSSEQAKFIKDLDLTILEQAEIIKKMQSKVEEQATIVNNLELTLKQQANLIDTLNLEIDEQLVIINNLNLNLAQKQELVNQLEITNEEQQFLVNQMRGSFAEQAEIIKELNLTIEDDAKLIKRYRLSLEGQAEIINGLRLTIDEMTELISKLELSEKDLISLVNSLKLTNLEKEEIITKLKLTIDQQQIVQKETTIWKKIAIGSGILFILRLIFW